jgi:phosphoserine phosphatase
VIKPVEALADQVVAATIREKDGLLTGDLSRPPMVGEARASWLYNLAQENGVDLAASYAYADSMSDLPLLESVGRPVAVNPDASLFRIARERKWPIESWRPDKGSPRVGVPELVR